VGAVEGRRQMGQVWLTMRPRSSRRKWQDLHPL